MNNWYPNLTGVAHDNVGFAIRKILDNVYATQGKVDGLAKSIPSKLTLSSADKADIANSLQINGSSPLNVAGLLGQLAQAQKALAPVSQASGAPSSGTNPNPQPGQLQIQNGQLFFFDDSTNPGQWRAVSATGVFVQDTFANITLYDATSYPLGAVFWATDATVGYTVQEVSTVNTWVYAWGTNFLGDITLLPTLTTTDAGFKLYDVNWDHTWQWDGTAWHYQPDEPSEPGDVKWRASTATPLKNGWQVCDGSTVTATQDDATTTSVTVPNLFGQYAAGIAAGSYTGTQIPAVAPVATGGAVDPTSLSPSSASFAPAGSPAITSFSDPHSHTMTQPTISDVGRPPTVLLVPYYRL